MNSECVFQYLIVVHEVHANNTTDEQNEEHETPEQPVCDYRCLDRRPDQSKQAISAIANNTL
jgi:hypothetical protein